MWNKNKQQRLNELQKRELENLLTVEEANELENLFSELENEEWQMLNPAIERERSVEIKLREELNLIETQNVVLTALNERQADLTKRAAIQLRNLQNEFEVLKKERQRILHDLAA